MIFLKKTYAMLYVYSYIKNKMITDIKDILVGHWTDLDNKTGCTALISKNPLVASCDIRGGAPGTRDIALLDPLATAQSINGILLSGGSAFGLDATSGVVKFLEDQKIGLKFANYHPIPLVPSAVIFDLSVGSSKVKPRLEEGYIAAKNATKKLILGNVGVGTGCTVGKILGTKYAMKGGIGSHTIVFNDGVMVSSLVAVNSLGSIYDPDTSEILAGPNKKGQILDTIDLLLKSTTPKTRLENTTIGIVATNASISKLDCKKLAMGANDGLAMSVRPSHTSSDGDLFFGISTSEKETKISIEQLYAASVRSTYKAIINAIKITNK